MKNIEKKDRIQKKAINSWVENGKCNTVEIVTGLGKMFIGFHALYTMPKDDKVHLFLAEVTDRKKDLLKQIKLYNEIFSRDILNDYKLKFYCYQTVYKWKNKSFGLVIADEITDSITPSYSQFYFNNNYNALIGLTAFINRKTFYDLEDGNFTTKGELIDKIAPVCFKYKLRESKLEKTSRKTIINVIGNTLEKTLKTVKGGSKNKPFYQTEQSAYKYWNDRFNKAINKVIDVSNIENSTLRAKEYQNQFNKKEKDIMISSRKRSNILYKSINKVKQTKLLLNNLKSKSIIFSNDLDSLCEVTPNVISSRNSSAQNNKIRDDFDKGLVSTIGSFKKLKQGANLKDLDNVIMMSYYSTEGDYIQRVGRLRDNGELGHIFIFLTKGTQEEIWFNKMIENINKDNINYYNNINEYLNGI